MSCHGKIPVSKFCWDTCIPFLPNISTIVSTLLFFFDIIFLFAVRALHVSKYVERGCYKKWRKNIRSWKNLPKKFALRACSTFSMWHSPSSSFCSSCSSQSLVRFLLLTSFACFFNLSRIEGSSSSFTSRCSRVFCSFFLYKSDLSLA